MEQNVDIRWIIKQCVHPPETTNFDAVLIHPLLPKSVYYNSPIVEVEVNSKTSTSDVDFIDPLGVATEEEVLAGPSCTTVDVDLLNTNDFSKRTSVILHNTLESKPIDRVIIDVNLPDFESWKSKRVQILNTYSTNEKLSISSSFLGVPKTKSGLSDKKKRRMEMLEDMSGLKKISELSQAEFVSHVNDLRELLIFAWDNNKRVEAIRIVTELARMLSSQLNAQFYPNQWILVTDILDLFGKLVFNRLLLKANEECQAQGLPKLSETFNSNEVPLKAAEVAKNWFCKIADIKELIPRFYVETALISCLNFLDSSSCHVNLLRLCGMAGKLPQPLLGAYARAYVCKIAMHFNPSDRAIHWKALNDSMQQSNIYLPELTSPAYEWIIQCVSYAATTVDDLGPLWEYAKMDDKRFLVSSFVKSVSPRYLASLSMPFCELVLCKNPTVFDVCTFGERLLLVETPEKDRYNILLRISKFLAKLPNFTDYVVGYATWSKFIGRYFDFPDLCDVASGLSKRLQKESRFSDESFELVVKIVNNLLTAKKYNSDLLRNECFQTVLEYLRDEPYASACAKTILAEFIRTYTYGSLTDYLIADIILEQCRALCECLNPDSVSDEIRIASRLICCSLDRISLNNDRERGLSLLVKARGLLSELPEVTEHIVFLMIEFVLHHQIHSENSAKKAAFMRACVANLYITIPSIPDNSVRIIALLRTMCISLMISSMPQCFSICNFILKSFESSEVSTQFVSQCCHFLSILVSVGDPANTSYLHFYDRFIDVIEKKKWKDPFLKFETWIACLGYLINVSLPEIPSKIIGVEANDSLYGSSTEYLSVVQDRITNAMDVMIDMIESEDPSKPLISIGLAEFIVENFELSSMIIKMILNLVKRVLRSGIYQRRVQDILITLKNLDSDDTTLAKFLTKLAI